MKGLKGAVEQAIRELRADHYPIWSSVEAVKADKDPIGCGMCFPHDGSWPCTSSLIADELAAAIAEQT